MAQKIIENFPVKNIFLNSGKNNALEKEIMEKAFNKKIKVKNIHNYHLKIAEFTFNIYSLNNKLDENDDSLVIETEINGYKLLFMGDASAKSENYLLKKHHFNNIDILKVAHHGSNTSTSPNFVKKVNPKYSLLSVGENNIYNHPSLTVLKKLKNSVIYRTDKDGSVKFLFTNKLQIKKQSP